MTVHEQQRIDEDEPTPMTITLPAQHLNPGPKPIDPLQAQTHRERLEQQAQTHREKLEIWINFTANGLAFAIVAGFFGIIAIALLGFADITNATVAAFIGTTLGYVVGSIAPISQFYYKMVPAKIEGWLPEKQTAKAEPPAPPPPSPPSTRP